MFARQGGFPRWHCRQNQTVERRKCPLATFTLGSEFCIFHSEGCSLRLLRGPLASCLGWEDMVVALIDVHDASVFNGVSFSITGFEYQLIKMFINCWSINVAHEGRAAYRYPAGRYEWIDSLSTHRTAPPPHGR